MANLELNSQHAPEKVGTPYFIFDSRVVTALLTVLTLGLYLAYYYFCLSRTSHIAYLNFNPPYGHVRRNHEYEPVRENTELNRYLRGSIRSQTSDPSFARVLRSIANNLIIMASGAINLINFLWSPRFARGRADNYLKGRLAEKERLGHEYMTYLEEQLGLNSRDLPDPVNLQISPSGEFPITRRSYLVPFLFVFTFSLLSILTLGLFPVAYLFKSGGRGFISPLGDNYLGRARFLGQVRGLISNGDDVSGWETHGPFDNDPGQGDAYSTELFKCRRGTVMGALVALTMGIFGLVILSRALFSRELPPLTRCPSGSGRFRAHLHDLRVASLQSAHRARSIAENMGEPPTELGYPLATLLRLTLSGTYQWVLCLIFTLSLLASLFTLPALGLPVVSPWLLLNLLFLGSLCSHIGYLSH